jgi:FkbM family methyltransferase
MQERMTMYARLANKILRTAGLKLEHLDNQSWHVGDVADRVSTLIDVGVAHGTPAFYALNPNAELFLIDPLKEYEESIRGVLKRRRGGHEIAALGHEKGNIAMNVQLDHLTKSSILEHTTLTRLTGRVERRIVPVTTLDDIVHKHGLTPPFGIKIDAEGFELNVIRGAAKTLASSVFAIIETSVQRRFERSYGFLEFLNEMHQRGFDVANILSAKRDKNGLVRFMDILYVREDQL